MTAAEGLTESVHVERDGCGTRVSQRRAASIKARLRQKQTAQARVEAAMEPSRYGPGGSEVGRHPVAETTSELIDRLRKHVAAEKAR